MPGRKRDNSGVKADPGTVWRLGDNKNIVHVGDGLYSYSGPGEESQEDIGTLCTVQPLDPGGGTFEVKIVDTGERNCIAIGVCHQGYPPNFLPGWNETSVAFHTDEGSLFHSSDDPEALNLPCKAGDSIRCSLFNKLNDPNNVLVRFYRNGSWIAQVAAQVPAGGFHGVIGMMSKGEQVQLLPLMRAQVVDFERLWTVCTPNRISHQGEGCCAYVGHEDVTQQNVGTVRKKLKIDPTSSSGNYLQVQILEAGKDRCIAVGVCSSSYPINLLPGWDEPSVGYHADNGQVFKNNADEGHPTGQLCQTGDIIRCTVEPVDGSTKEVRVVFHRNEALVIHTNIWTPDGGLFFCVGMMSPDEKVRIILPEVLSPYISQKLSFTDVWEIAYPIVDHQGNGVCVYTGSGDHVGTVRSKQPLDACDSSKNTFEVKIVRAGNNCCIAIGVCSSTSPTNIMPGWEESSIGYHADDGCIHQGETARHCTGHVCQTGDVMRCTVEPQDSAKKEVAVLFYKNGELMNRVIQWSPSGGYYGLVGMMSRGEVVQISSPSTDPSSSVQPSPEGAVPRHQGDPVASLYPQPSPLPTSDWSGAGGASMHQHSGYHPLSSSFSGVLPMHPPSSYHFQGPSAIHPPYYTQEHSLYHHQARPPYHPQDYPPYHLQEHSAYYTREHPFYRPQEHRPSYHPQERPPFYPPSPSNLSLPFHSVASEPYFNRNPAYGDTRYGQEYGRTAYMQDEHGRMYGQQISTPDPSQGPSDEVDEKSETRRALSTPPLPTEEPPSYVWSPSPTLVGTRPVAAKVQEDGRGGAEYGGVDSVDYPRAGGGSRTEKMSKLTDEKCDITKDKDGLTKEKDDFTEVKSDPTEEKDDLNKEKGDLNEKKDDLSEGKSIRTEENQSTIHGAHILQRLMSTSALPDIPPLTRTCNKTFQFLHNVVTLDSGNLQCSADRAGDIGYVMCRQPLSEKLPYYEVEITHATEGGLVQVGLVWNGFPPRKLPGMLQGSVAYNSCTGTLHTGAASCRQVSSPCAVGDIIGCKAHLHYKQEMVHKGDNGNIESVTVEFFRNGCLLGADNVSLPPSGLFPAIGLVGQGMQVKFSRCITLSAETYFKTHPLPAGFVNFTPPPSVNLLWGCMQNARVTDDGLVLRPLHHAGLATVVQSNLPFTMSHSFCELHLQIPLNRFSTLSVGVLPKISPSSKSAEMIPGESQNSVGFLPLLGFIMKNGVITLTIPDFVTSDIKACTSTIDIGFGIHFNATPSSTAAGLGAETAEVFFTISQQQVSSIIVTLPPNGLYPSVVFDTDYKAEGQALAKIDFPVLWPDVKNLPYGFVRASDSITAKKKCIMYSASTDKASVSCLQAGFPLSPVHSYYEVMVRNVCGDAPKLAVGLASFRHRLDLLPGLGKDSIAFHAHDGAVYEPGVGRETVAPGSCNAWLKLGCGARFSADGSTRYAEVFFALNRTIICRRLIQIPPLGLFPTIGLQDFTGCMDINPFAPDPFPDLAFSTHWRLLENIQLSGQHMNIKIPTKVGLAQLACPASPSEVTYFTVSLQQPINRSAGKVFIGFSNSNDTPFSNDQPPTYRSCILDVVSGTIIWCDPHFHSDDIGLSANGRVFGCGIWVLDGNTTLLFFTLDNQVIYCTPLVGVSGPMFPTVCLIDCRIRLSVDACASWPPLSRIGKGWSRSSNLVVVNSEICHAQVPSTSAKSSVGFAQAAFPLIPARPYFEVEITSQDPKKTIAVGLASREYPVNSWIGDQENSVAYYSDSGKLYANSSIGKEFGPRLVAGNTVGCGVAFTTNNYTSNRKGQTAEVFFTVNGAIIGRKKVTVPHGGFFPTVCLDSSASIVPSFHSKFPPTLGFVGRDWAIAYSIYQIGQLMCHRGGNHNISGGVPKAFCQAAAMLSSKQPYFEIEVVSFSSMSTISMGVGIRQEAQATFIEQDSLLYSSKGEILTRRGTQKSTQMSQKYSVGDIIGCSVICGSSLSVEFYRNGTKVTSVVLFEGPLKTQPLFPLISLSHPGDAVIPRLCLPLPQWDSSALLGWLRTERVSIRNNVLEYNGLQAEVYDVGVAQMSQPLARPGIAYYELEILDTGGDCAIGIGAASATYPLTHQPGWGADSIGYHGDDGCVFRTSGTGESFGPSWKRQDVIGLGIRSTLASVKPDSELQVYFARNGQELGHLTMDIPATGLFPTIGLHSKGAKVKVSMSTSGHCSNSDPGRLMWRALCGVTLRKDNRGLAVLECCPRQHKTAPSGYRFGVAIAQQPLSNTMQYFEVQLLQFGKLRAISIGVVRRNYSLQLVCGWASGSIGYHTDDGKLYNQSESGQVFGPIPSLRSTIGCGVCFIPNSTKHCFVFFTYNGTEIGRVRTAIPDGGFYPSVTMTSSGDKVAVSFQETFKPKFSEGELQVVGLLRIVNCSYSNQLLHYTGSSGTDPAIAQFAVALHQDCNYYCANVVNLKDTVVFGLATRDFSVRDIPGRSSVSVAYDITNGQIDAVYNVDKCFQFRAPKCCPGDTVGCGVEASESKAVQGYVFFTRNGMVVQKIELNYVFDDLYPIVGIRSINNDSSLFMVWSDVQMPVPNNF